MKIQLPTSGILLSVGEAIVDNQIRPLLIRVPKELIQTTHEPPNSGSCILKEKMIKEKEERIKQNKQILMKEEKDLLKAYIQYDAAIILFQPYIEKWCILGRNQPEVIATLLPHMLTLDREKIHFIDELLNS